MFERSNRGLLTAGIVLLMLSGCATFHPGGASTVSAPPPESGDLSTTRRVVTQRDLLQVQREDPALTVSRSVQILARLNRKDPAYIQKDINHHKPLKAPNDFSSYRDWTPLPRDIPEIKDLPRFILVVKNIPFLGWYENGRLVGDTYVGIGRKKDWTRAGFYRVDKKDPVHWSTYPDAYGDQAVMPDALHIYARVWIHLGDVIGPYCSHGCINVPMGYSGKLWDWATVGAPVLVTPSLKSLHRDLRAALRKKVLRHKTGKSRPKKQVKAT